MIEHSVVRGPVIIGARARIVHAYVGPFTSIMNDAEVRESEIEHSILLEGSSISNLVTRVEDSLIGKNVKIYRLPGEAVRVPLHARRQFRGRHPMVERPLQHAIHGVQGQALRVIPDERGWLMEILRGDDPELFSRFGQVYVSATYPGVVKAWHYHERQTDNFACIAGMIKLVLVDTRDDSPTRNAVNEFFIGTQNPMLVQVPNLVYHGWKCISPEPPSLVVNVPDEPYNSDSSGRAAGSRRTGPSPTIGPGRMVDVLVTGGAGFIGSNFVRYAIDAHPDWRVTTLDKLTYAGRLENLEGLLDHPRHSLREGRRRRRRRRGAAGAASDIVVHFAAETHVDRSILSAGEFITTDVYGTFVLLEAARRGVAPAAVRPDLDRRGLRQRRRRATAARPTSCGRAIPTRRARPAPIGSPTATGRPTRCR